MESRFGHDFSRVRVHTDSKATQAARAVNAHAFTAGEEIIFDQDRFGPTTESELGPRTTLETLCKTYSDKYNKCDDPSSKCDKTKSQCGDPYPAGGPFSPIDSMAIDLCKSQGISDINLCRLINGSPMVEDDVWLYEHGYSKKRPK